MHYWFRFIKLISTKMSKSVKQFKEIEKKKHAKKTMCRWNHKTNIQKTCMPTWHALLEQFNSSLRRHTIAFSFKLLAEANVHLSSSPMNTNQSRLASLQCAVCLFIFIMTFTILNVVQAVPVHACECSLIIRWMLHPSLYHHRNYTVCNASVAQL